MSGVLAVTRAPVTCDECARITWRLASAERMHRDALRDLRATGRWTLRAVVQSWAEQVRTERLIRDAHTGVAHRQEEQP